MASLSYCSALKLLLVTTQDCYHKALCLTLLLDAKILKTTVSKCPLWWDGSHSAEVNENIILGYSQDQGYS